MKQVFDESRRELLKKVALGTVLIPLAVRTASAADLPLVSTDDPTAKVGRRQTRQQMRDLRALPGRGRLRPGRLSPVPGQGRQGRRLVRFLGCETAEVADRRQLR